MRKILFAIGGILLVASFAINFRISLNQNESLLFSISTVQNAAMADDPENGQEGTIEQNTDCVYAWWAWDPVMGEWHYYESPGHITDCLIEFIHLGCVEHDCIWDM